MAVLAAAACGVEEISHRPDGGPGDAWTGPGMSVGPSSKETCYVTGFDYPDEYDWRTDPEKGSVKCSLVVFADGQLMIKVPVGEDYEVSSDPDMHRMADGHLYTDYSTETETVIKKDGRDFLRYSGREIICGLLVQEDTVYTLGHPRGGSGFVFRKNGQIVLERSSGKSFGRLQLDEGRICFAFVEPVNAGDELIERYYHYTDGEIVQAAVRDDVRKVWDMVSHRGEVCYIASLTGVQRPVLFHEGQISALSLPDADNPLSFEMVHGGDVLFWKGLFASSEGSVASILWHKPEYYVRFEDGMVAGSFCMAGDGICCTLNHSGKSGIIYRCGEIFPMPEGYVVMGGSCSAVSNGILHVGLSSLVGEQPTIWRDGEITALDICGYIASVSVD